jgi:hypothetical protein
MVFEMTYYTTKTYIVKAKRNPIRIGSENLICWTTHSSQQHAVKHVSSR